MCYDRLEIIWGGIIRPYDQAGYGAVPASRTHPYARRIQMVRGLTQEETAMTKFAPSILSADFVNLERDIREISANGGDWVHIDVMDGLFVPNLTIGIPVVKAIRGITDLTLDVHLMIDRPIRYVEHFVKAGSDYLSIHIEADTLANNLAALDKIAELGGKRRFRT